MPWAYPNQPKTRQFRRYKVRYSSRTDKMGIRFFAPCVRHHLLVPQGNALSHHTLRTWNVVSPLKVSWFSHYRRLRSRVRQSGRRKDSAFSPKRLRLPSSGLSGISGKLPPKVVGSALRVKKKRKVEIVIKRLKM